MVDPKVWRRIKLLAARRECSVASLLDTYLSKLVVVPRQLNR